MNQQATQSAVAAEVGRGLALPEVRVRAALELFESGATVPFVARYRKEATGGLDEVQLRAIQEQSGLVVELYKRRGYVLKTIEEQGKLTPELRQRIAACRNKAELEDLFLPFKPKRRTKAQVARERGLGPLADLVLKQPERIDAKQELMRYVNRQRDLPSLDDVREGLSEILAEVIAERAEVRQYLRENALSYGVIRSKAKKASKGVRSKFEDYYDYEERLSRIPSHRYLALCRGEDEGVLRVGLSLEDERVLSRLERIIGVRPRSPFSADLLEALSFAYRKKLLPSIGKEVRAAIKEQADETAIDVFARNLENLLLSAPFGARKVVGIDPGLRTGCKCAAIDATGKYLESVTIYPTRDPARAEAELRSFLKRHRPDAIAVGNGTGGRETERFVRDGLRQGDGPSPQVVMVNESGASIYSASDVAREEFPDLDLTIRGAISIGRRLQDPLAELVKIEPKSIGVGQYQHDVHQGRLQQKLTEVVESAVNRVGVDVNTASASLLSYVAGLGAVTSQNLVAYRNQHGPFGSRAELKKAKGVGARAFEQSAGFLRIRNGKNALDASAVHPERYAVVQQMAKDLGVKLAELVGHPDRVQRIDVSRYVTDEVGEPTLRDILLELQKPGRDPRERFVGTQFRDDLNEISDLREGMILNGVVTNVAAFGCFVDLGVHQDGLVHVSELADRFVRDPNEVVRVGQAVKVKVLSVDLARKRISLSIKAAA